MSKPRNTTVSLLSVADLVRGVSYSREEARRQPGPGLIPIVRANNIHNGELLFDDLIYVPTSRVSPAQRIRRGDIVLAMSSGSRDVVGKAAVARADWEGGFGAFCGVLRARSGTRSWWLAHFMQSPPYRDAIEALATGTNINNLSKTTLAAVQVPQMPDETQRELVAFLDRTSASHKSCATHFARGRRAIERFRLAVLAAASSGRLTQDWRQKDDDDAGSRLAQRLVASSGSKLREQWRILELANQLGELPEMWGAAPFGALTVNHDGQRIPVRAADRAKRQGRYPYYGASGIIDHVDDYLFDGDFLLVSEDGANLLARVTPIAFRASGKFWVNNHAHVVQARDGILDAYLEIVINSKDIQKHVTGSAQPKLTQGALNQLPVPLPSTAEQAEIVRRVSQLMTSADRVLQRIDKGGKTLHWSAHAVLAQAFRDEIIAPQADAVGAGWG